MYLVRIAASASGSAVDVAKLQDLEQAISFGFQLHQISSCKHHISVLEDGSKIVATYTRTDTFTIPCQKSDSPADSSARVPSSKPSVFGLRKKS